ncbi:MAG: AAA family ATPase [bacterium]
MKLKNFKGRIPNGYLIDAKFDPEVNIFVGLNGVGKTLFLEELAKKASEDGIPYAFFKEDEDVSQVSMEKRKKVIEWDKDKEYYEIFHNILSQEKISLGQRRFISLIFFLLENKDKDIIFIDTPESNLHVRIQLDLIKMIRKICPKSQIFLTIHSPAITMEGWFGIEVQMHEIIIATGKNPPLERE